MGQISIETFGCIQPGREINQNVILMESPESGIDFLLFFRICKAWKAPNKTFCF